jgi:hypothetical protein
MSDANHPDNLALRIWTMQIIAGAMVLGVSVFLVIALVLRGAGNMLQPPDTSLISYVALAFGIMILVPYCLVPNIVAKAAIRQSARYRNAGGAESTAGPSNTEPSELCAVFQTRLIISAALLEGVAFFALIAYIAEGQQLSLIQAIVFLGGLLLQFPTRSKVERWIEKQQEMIQQEQWAG